MNCKASISHQLRQITGELVVGQNVEASFIVEASCPCRCYLLVGEAAVVEADVEEVIAVVVHAHRQALRG
nr:unnamed protein product [Digitaria exilis]